MGIDSSAGRPLGPAAHFPLNLLNAAVRPQRVAARLSGWEQTLVFLSLAVGVTVALTAVPELRFAYEGPAVRAALETAVVLVSLFAAAVVYGRARLARTLPNLLLLVALTVIAAGTLVGAALPAVLHGGTFRHVSTWGPLLTSTVAGTFLAAAGLAARERTVDVSPRRVVGLVLVVTAGGALLLTVVPLPGTGISPSLAPDASARPLLTGSVALLELDVASVLAHLVAGVAFLVRREAGDRLRTSIGNACLLVVAARVDYLLFPSLDLRWFYVGDVWRVGAYGLILWAVFGELQGYWTRLAETATLEERRRLARELHDGVAQELALLAAEAEPRTAAAAQRALDESRRAIAALTRPLDEPFALTLRRETEELAHRLDTRVSCHVDVRPEPAPGVREALLRIAREAVTNAGRHADASLVTVRLVGERGVLALAVRDDGCGMSTPRPGGFGITSMRERAAALGGTLEIASAPGQGTTVEVRVPCRGC